jgi:hypothetical protein
MASKSTAPENQVNRISTAIQVGLWIAILVVAFFMQAVPFFLVLTMFNLAVGISSGVALILIPVAAFGMLSFACWIATRRARNILPDPLPPQQTYIAPYGVADGNPLTANQRLVTVLQRLRWRWF